LTLLRSRRGSPAVLLISVPYAMQNASFADYHIYSMRDRPTIKAILVPSYEDTGPFGAKSVSEICINGPAPAIGNAIYNATGARLNEFPFTPEKVLAAIKAVKK